MGFEKGSKVSITLFDPLIFPNGKGLDQFEYLYIHKVTSEMVIVETEKKNRIQIPIEKISSIDDGANRIEFARNLEETLDANKPVEEKELEVKEENYLDGINSGDRIYYRYKGVGYEKTVGLEDNDDDFPNLVWFVSKEELKFQDLITFRSMDNTKKVTEGEWSSAIILWIKKHPDQLQMPPLTE